MKKLAGLVFATLAVITIAAPVRAQNVVNTVPGTFNATLGGYLWQYQVTSGSSPALSHWVLGICNNAFSDILPGSVGYTPGLNPITGFVATPGSQITFGTDPTTALNGIKFDYGYNDGQIRYVRFVLTEDYEPAILTAKTKSGGDVDTFSVVGPSCNVSVQQIPEPGVLALLATGLPLAVGVVRRRRAA
jgi:hypothetical protein